MPELPEVETVRKVLKRNVLKKKITKVNIYYDNIVENDNEYFKQILTGNVIKDIKRRGKYLIFELEEHYLISHLRMEGKYFYKEDNKDIEKHDHVEIIFEDYTKLVYNDTRKFGRMKLITKNLLEEYFSKLADEPKDIDINLLTSKINRSNKPIKSILLDQSVIAGLGNIYVNEVLYKSLVNPMKKGCDISKEEIIKVVKSSILILDKSIIEGGCTIKSYTSSLGVTGNYQNYLKVHMKENELCEKCNSKILKIKIDGRSTYYCENCQK